MKIATWAKLLFLGVPVLAGCANFWQMPTNNSSGNSSTSTLSSGIFYVLNQTTAQIAGYSMVTGTLTAVTNSPYTLASAPYSMAIAPNGEFLYVSTQTGIYLYTIGSGGILTAGSSTAISDDTTGFAVAVDRTNSWLIDASANGAVYAIPINSSTGVNSSSTAQAVQIPGTAVQQVAVSPDNNFIFVTSGSYGTTVIPFFSGNKDPFGTPISFSVKGSGGAAVSVAVDPITSTVTTPRLFYVGETAVTSTGSNTGGVRAFSYSALLNNGTITEVSGSPYSSGGLGPYSILPKSTGDYVYVANRTVSGSSTGNIVAFAVTASGSTYSLTVQSSTASTGTYPVSLAEDSESNYLFVANSGGSSDLQGYNFDTTTAGKLDSVLTSSTGTDPVGAIQVATIP